MLQPTNRSVRSLVFAACVGSSLMGCGGDEVKYNPRPAPSAKASLPPVPNVPKTPVKDGENYTIWGASYYFRSAVHRKEVLGQRLSLKGFISHTNLLDAPECAVHEPGKADPADCKTVPPMFWICDSKDAKDEDCIQVMGWASNYAQLYGAIEEAKKAKEGDKVEYMDTFLAKPIPYPIPAAGAEVVATGQYAGTYSTSLGTEANPIMGILTLEKLEYVTPAPEPATLPGMEKKK